MGSSSSRFNEPINVGGPTPSRDPRGNDPVRPTPFGDMRAENVHRVPMAEPQSSFRREDHQDSYRRFDSGDPRRQADYPPRSMDSDQRDSSFHRPDSSAMRGDFSGRGMTDNSGFGRNDSNGDGWRDSSIDQRRLNQVCLFICC